MINDLDNPKNRAKIPASKRETLEPSYKYSDADFDSKITNSRNRRAPESPAELEDDDTEKLIADLEEIPGIAINEFSPVQSLENIGDQCYEYLQSLGQGNHENYLKTLAPELMEKVMRYSKNYDVKAVFVANQIEELREEISQIDQENFQKEAGLKRTREILGKHTNKLVERDSAEKAAAEKASQDSAKKAFQDFKNEQPALTAEELKFAKDCADYLIADRKSVRPKSSAFADLSDFEIDFEIKTSANEYAQWMVDKGDWRVAHFTPEIVYGKTKLMAKREVDSKDKKVKQIEFIGDKLMPAGDYYFKNKVVGNPDKDGNQKVLAEIIFARMKPEAKKVFSDSVKADVSKKFVKADRGI